ncbi:hypothetical protein JRI60_47310 [Archangium violaceum]|uniref:hypothetical protein n=1 Tax=Archangium violaceum TaxID=83451 RepID=UPI0019509DE6|nr:hypothetical protein [Archangium violaceum]QRN96532.1 hypothetical protein JRI60_47310 [Archangium violaceum]
MSWEYHALKRRLGLGTEPLLGLFEEFCLDAFAAMRDMEWSCKVCPDVVLTDRFFWLGAPTDSALYAPGLRLLLDALRFEPTGLPGGRARFEALVAEETERLLVAYAGPDPRSGRAAQLKVYLTLKDCSAARYHELLRPVLPALPAEPPPEEATLLFCYALEAGGSARPRLYVQFREEAYQKPRIARYMEERVGTRGLALARGHRASGVALKEGATEMLGLGLRPTGAEGPHPCQVISPVALPLLEAARRVPLLAERLDRVSWVTLANDEDSLRCQTHQREMNVYVKLLR